MSKALTAILIVVTIGASCAYAFGGLVSGLGVLLVVALITVALRLGGRQ